MGHFFGWLEVNLLPVLFILLITATVINAQCTYPHIYIPFLRECTDCLFPRNKTIILDNSGPPGPWLMRGVCFDMRALVRLRTWDSSGHQPPGQSGGSSRTLAHTLLRETGDRRDSPSDSDTNISWHSTNPKSFPFNPEKY